MNDIELNVQGMSCGGCESAIKGAVSRLPNVASVQADHQSGRVNVKGDGPVDEAAVREAITEAGFSVV